LHAAVWPDVLVIIRAAIFAIIRSICGGCRTAGTDDFAVDMAVVVADPVTQKW
jgi:hypothetical protein